MEFTYHIECSLVLVIVDTIQDIFHILKNILDGYELTRNTSEVLRYEHRLGKVVSQHSGTIEDLLVRLGQLLDTQNCDDLLQFLITCQITDGLLHQMIVALAHLLRINES